MYIGSKRKDKINMTYIYELFSRFGLSFLAAIFGYEQFNITDTKKLCYEYNWKLYLNKYLVYFVIYNQSNYATKYFAFKTRRFFQQI